MSNIKKSKDAKTYSRFFTCIFIWIIEVLVPYRVKLIRDLSLIYSTNLLIFLLWLQLYEKAESDQERTRIMMGFKGCPNKEVFDMIMKYILSVSLAFLMFKSFPYNLRVRILSLKIFLRLIDGNLIKTLCWMLKLI